LSSREVKYFGIEVEGPVVLVVQTLGYLDTVGTLMDQSRREIATDDDSGSGRNFRIISVLTRGYYYVRISPYPGDAGPYTLVVNRLER